MVASRLAILVMLACEQSRIACITLFLFFCFNFTTFISPLCLPPGPKIRRIFQRKHFNWRRSASHHDIVDIWDMGGLLLVVFPLCSAFVCPPLAGPRAGSSLSRRNTLYFPEISQHDVIRLHEFLTGGLIRVKMIVLIVLIDCLL